MTWIMLQTVTHPWVTIDFIFKQHILTVKSSKTP